MNTVLETCSLAFGEKNSQGCSTGHSRLRLFPLLRDGVLNKYMQVCLSRDE